MTSVELAQASNAAVYATMVSLTFAMVCFAISFAAGRRRPAVVQEHVTSVASSGGAAVITRLLHSWIAWPVSGFTATGVYLVVLAAQLSVGRRAD